MAKRKLDRWQRSTAAGAAKLRRIAAEVLAADARGECPEFDACDEQMRADAAAGRLDEVLKRVDAEIGAGKLRDLP